MRSMDRDEKLAVEKLLEAMGLTMMDYERFLYTGTFDFERSDPSSPLGKYIQKVKDDCSAAYDGCD